MIPRLVSFYLSQISHLQIRIFHSQDVNLQKWPWMEFYDNILDIGYFGKWHHLKTNFIDYDINREEIDQLPNA